MPFGRCGGTREAGNTVAGEYGSALSGGYAPDSAKAEGSSIVDETGRADPCARESKARAGRFLQGNADV